MTRQALSEARCLGCGECRPPEWGTVMWTESWQEIEQADHAHRWQWAIGAAACIECGKTVGEVFR